MDYEDTKHDYVQTGNVGDDEVEFRCTICGRYMYKPWSSEDGA